MTETRWGILYPDVYPLDDLREHNLYGPCWCDPVIDEDGIVVHNSMDRREFYERGERKPS